MNNKCVLLNAKKMNFDGKLDFSILSSDLTVYDDTTPQQLLKRIQNANIIITKEMEVSGEMIRQFPDSVKLICEAGTGYNNIDLDAAKEKKITVCNIPSYSSKRVAHTAIMMILNLSSTIQTQMKMLGNGNHDNFTHNLQVPHVEVNGKTLGVVGAGHIGKNVIKIAQALCSYLQCRNKRKCRYFFAVAGLDHFSGSIKRTWGEGIYLFYGERSGSAE